MPGRAKPWDSLMEAVKPGSALLTFESTVLVDLHSALLASASAVKTERKTVWIRWLKTTADTAFEAVQIPNGITQLKGIKVLVLLLLESLPKLLLAGEEEAWPSWCC